VTTCWVPLVKEPSDLAMHCMIPPHPQASTNSKDAAMPLESGNSTSGATAFADSRVWFTALGIAGMGGAVMGAL
jgi:hypothetical protein